LKSEQSPTVNVELVQDSTGQSENKLTWEEKKGLAVLFAIYFIGVKFSLNLAA